MTNILPATLMRSEILEQPEALSRLVQNARSVLFEVAERAQNAPFAVLAARGSSDNASTYGKYLLEGLAGIPTALSAPSLFTLYKTPPRLKNALVIGVSQSGHAADVVEVMQEAKRQGAITLAITNTADSPLSKVADHLVLLDVGLERALAATKTVTAQCTVYALLVSLMARHHELALSLQTLGQQVSSAIAQESAIKASTEEWQYVDRAVILGRGYVYGSVQETALKLKETCYMSAESYSSADFKHGPLALIEHGYPVLAYLNHDATLAMTLELVQHIVGRGAKVSVICSDKYVMNSSLTGGITLEASSPLLSPIPFIVAGQLFAMHLATRKGYNPDVSRGLTKVTVTI